VSSEAIRTFLPSRSVSRLAILPEVVVLPEPCRPTIMMDDRAAALRSIATPVGAQHLDQLVVDDLDDHLAGRDRLQVTSAPTAFRAPCIGEGAHDFERHVRLEQRTAHLAQRRGDIGLGQRAAARSDPFRMEPRRSWSVSNITSFVLVLWRVPER
jgi:hypothetical protein